LVTKYSLFADAHSRVPAAVFVYIFLKVTASAPLPINAFPESSDALPVPPLATDKIPSTPGLGLD
jgi:hypothetical protein